MIILRSGSDNAMGLRCCYFRERSRQVLVQGFGFEVQHPETNRLLGVKAQQKIRHLKGRICYKILRRVMAHSLL